MRFVLALVIALCAGMPAWSAPVSPCAKATLDGTTCNAARDKAAKLMKARHLSGSVVVEDVQSGTILVTSDVRSRFTFPNAGNSKPPLSLAKLFLAASIWTHANDVADRQALDTRVRQMLVHSDDEEGRKLAFEERRRVGSSVVLADISGYGARTCVKHEQGEFVWEKNFISTLSNIGLLVDPGCTGLNERTDDSTWGSAFSLGENGFYLSLLHLVRFIQAIGNDGSMMAPIYRTKPGAHGARPESERSQIMPAAVARQLQQALLATVSSGTAQGVKDRMRGGWRIGGKTGTTAMHGTPFTGIFAGLVFDPKGEPRYAFVVYVERGGKGGGAAAEIACDLFNYILGL